MPQRKGRKDRRLQELLGLGLTVILYESPHRLVATLSRIRELSPEREVFVARELTKLHEEGLFGTAQSIFEELSSRTSVKGEIVLILGPGADERDTEPDTESDTEEDE